MTTPHEDELRAAVEYYRHICAEYVAGDALRVRLAALEWALSEINRLKEMNAKLLSIAKPLFKHAEDEHGLYGYDAKERARVIIDEAIKMTTIMSDNGKQIDDPCLDGTDAAHPAWWRGHDSAVRAICARANEIMNGKDHGEGVSNEPWECTRRRLLAAVAETERLTAALHKARSHPDYDYIVIPSNGKVAGGFAPGAWENNQEAVVVPGDECLRLKREK